MSTPRLPWPQHATPPGTVLVVGAGIAGTTAARLIAESGRQVVVVEAEAPAAGASGNPWGLLQPLPNLGSSPLGAWVTRGFHEGRTLAARLGLPWHPTRVARYARTQKVRRHAARLLEELDWGPDLEDPAQLTGVPSGAVLGLPGAVIPPAAWCTALLDHPAITVVRGAVTALHREDDLWHAIVGDESTHRGVAAIVASGPDATALVPELQLHRVRGQLIEVAATESTAPIPRALCGAGYLLPARDGRHVLGATYQRDDLDPHLRDADTAHLRERLTTTIPVDLGPTVGGRVAWRAVTEGRLPLVGPVVDTARAAESLTPSKRTRPWISQDALVPGLFVSVGHGSRGLVGAPLAASVLVAALAGQVPELAPDVADAVHPGRQVVARLRRG